MTYVCMCTQVRRCDLPHVKGGLIAVSQSGETKDVVRAVRASLAESIPVISVVNNVGSLISRTTGLGVYLNAGREHAVASTKAFVTQVTVLTLIGLWFRQLREAQDGVPESPMKKEFRDALQRLPISFGTAFRLHDKCREVALALNSKESMFILGEWVSE